MDYQIAVQLIGAAAAIAAVLAAIFRQQIVQLLAGPRLRITTASSNGVEVVEYWHDGDNESARVSTWYYHLRVINRRRSAPAREVRVFLLRVQDLRSSRIWTGEVELQWRFARPPPDLGPESECDLCVAADGLLRLIVPPTSHHHREILVTEYGPGAHLRLSVQARAFEGDSPVTWFDLSWQDDRPDDVRISRLNG